MAATFAVAVLAPCSALAQYKVNIDKPEVEDIQSPDNAGSIGGNKSFSPKDWMEIEVKFRIEAKDKDKKFADKVTIKWYVAAKNPEKNGRGFILLEKEITHINVPVGEDVYASIYLSPNSVQRLTGSDKISKSDIKNVGGTFVIDGLTPVDQKKGFFSLDGTKVWWNSGELARYDKIPLLNKAETPFKFLWWDRYAEIEAEK